MGLLQTVGAVALALGCYVEAQGMAEYRTASGLSFKIAIPQADIAPFDILFSLTAPVATGWAGFACGGSMLKNPLLVAWPNGNGVVVSPRWAT
jgi:hypothetical protein